MSLLLLLIPLFGIGLISLDTSYGLFPKNEIKIKWIALLSSIINLIVSLFMFILFVILLLIIPIIIYLFIYADNFHN